jgi:hypothetical protein
LAVFRAFRQVKAPVFGYSPFTAADEKIPPSVVHVNTEPQHLVFCSHFGHLVAQHQPFGCGNSQIAL